MNIVNPEVFGKPGSLECAECEATDGAAGHDKAQACVLSAPGSQGLGVVEVTGVSCTDNGDRCGCIIDCSDKNTGEIWTAWVNPRRGSC